MRNENDHAMTVHN